MNWPSLAIAGTLTIIWAFAAFIGFVLPVGWLTQWYGLPFCITTFVVAALWVGYCIAKEEGE